MTLKEYDDLILPVTRKAGMPDGIHAELLSEWKQFRKEHAGEHPEDISFEYELFPTKRGLISVVLEPDEGKINLTVKAEDMETGETVELDPVPPEAWDPIFPSTQLTAEKVIPPNAKCPCGSGKKYKKCCANKPQEAAATANAEEGG